MTNKKAMQMAMFNDPVEGLAFYAEHLMDAEMYEIFDLDGNFAYIMVEYDFH